MKNKLQEWQKEYSTQKKEHPSLPIWALKQIASDHLKLKGERR